MDAAGWFSATHSCHGRVDRKSTRLNSSHSQISYAVFCSKKKTADSLDAVPIPTDHGAKGLEWSSIYLPFLAIVHFPCKRLHEPYQPPAAIIVASEYGADD